MKMNKLVNVTVQVNVPTLWSDMKTARLVLKLLEAGMADAYDSLEAVEDEDLSCVEEFEVKGVNVP